MNGLTSPLQSARLGAVGLVILAFSAASANAAPDATKPPTSMAPAGVVAQGSRLSAHSATVRCPASITVQATNAPSPWLPNSVVLNVQSASLSGQAAPNQQMICSYTGSGYSWATMRVIQPEFKTCTPSGTQFVCTKP
jgi:hypothetical protein